LGDAGHLAIRIAFEWRRKVHGLLTRDRRLHPPCQHNPCNEECGKNSARGACWL
jgi:hypothetical protein